MNKIILVLIIIVLLTLAVAGYYMYQGNSNSLYPTNSTGVNTTPATTVIPSSETVVPSTATAPVQTNNLTASISIQNFAFNPSPLNIKVGTTVTWTNNDPMPHQIKSNTVNSSALSGGQTFSFTFTAAGQYDYSCAIHPSMLGQIIVTK